MAQNKGRNQKWNTIDQKTLNNCYEQTCQQTKKTRNWAKMSKKLATKGIRVDRKRIPQHFQRFVLKKTFKLDNNLQLKLINLRSQGKKISQIVKQKQFADTAQSAIKNSFYSIMKSYVRYCQSNAKNISLKTKNKGLRSKVLDYLINDKLIEKQVWEKLDQQDKESIKRNIQRTLKLFITYRKNKQQKRKTEIQQHCQSSLFDSVVQWINTLQESYLEYSYKKKRKSKNQVDNKKNNQDFKCPTKGQGNDATCNRMNQQQDQCFDFI